MFDSISVWIYFKAESQVNYKLKALVHQPKNPAWKPLAFLFHMDGFARRLVLPQRRQLASGPAIAYVNIENKPPLASTEKWEKKEK